MSESVDTESVKGVQVGPEKTVVTPPKPTVLGTPTQLKIRKIHVNAKVFKMGVDRSGNMKTPDNVGELGWYKYGSNPGNIGTAVIAGHLGIGAFEHGVFKNLSTLRKGDTIVVTDNKGVSATFVVRKTRIYDKDARPVEVFNSRDGKSHLNLITCTGIWIKSEKTMSKRLVVFTDKLK